MLLFHIYSVNGEDDIYLYDVRICQSWCLKHKQLPYWFADFWQECQTLVNMGWKYKREEWNCVRLLTTVHYISWNYLRQFYWKLSLLSWRQTVLPTTWWNIVLLDAECNTFLILAWLQMVFSTKSWVIILISNRYTV